MKKMSVPESEIHEEFVRSSGPGGQNVNKVSTGVELHFDVRHSPSLPDDVRTRLMAIAGHRMNKGGVLTVESQRYRTQERNRQDARERLMELIRQAEIPPKKRRKTRPSRASRVRRLELKRQRAATKRNRRRSALEE